MNTQKIITQTEKNFEMDTHETKMFEKTIKQIIEQKNELTTDEKILKRNIAKIIKNECETIEEPIYYALILAGWQIHITKSTDTILIIKDRHVSLSSGKESKIFQKKLTPEPKKQTIDDITLKNDENGICYNDYHNQLHVIGIDKKQYKFHTLKRKLRTKYNYNIMFDDIPNEFAQYDLYNPEDIDVIYLMWFDADLEKTNEEMIQEIKEYKYNKNEISFSQFKKIISTLQDTMFTIQGNPHIWYYRKGDKNINIGGGNPDTQRPLDWLKGKKVIIPQQGHIWRPFKPFHYWEQPNNGKYTIGE